MDGRKIPHGLLVKEMFSAKDDETISGSRVVGWGHPSHVREENNAQLHFPSGTDGEPCISSHIQKNQNFFLRLWNGL